MAWSANLAGGTSTRFGSFTGQVSFEEKTSMIGKILGAIAGEKLAGRNSRASGALIGAALPYIARRGLGPLGLALGAGWAAKKLYDRSRARRAPFA